MYRTLPTTQRPVRASVAIPPIGQVEVKVVNDTILIKLLTDDHWGALNVYLEPAAATALEDGLARALDEIEGHCEPIYPGIVIEDEPLIGAVR